MGSSTVPDRVPRSPLKRRDPARLGLQLSLERLSPSLQTAPHPSTNRSPNSKNLTLGARVYQSPTSQRQFSIFGKCFPCGSDQILERNQVKGGREREKEVASLFKKGQIL